MPLRAHIITDLSELADLQSAWQALVIRVGGSVDFFTSHAWTSAYLAHHQPPDWFVVTIYETDSQQLCAVFPLQRLRLNYESHQFSACKALGLPYLHYLDFAVRSLERREAITFLLNQVLRAHLQIDLVFFWPLHEDSKLYLTLVEDLGAHPALKYDRFPSNLHHIDGRSQSFADYTQSRPRHTFQDAAYCLRRLTKKGTLSWANSTDAQTLAPAVRQLCQWNQTRFNTRHAYAHFADWPDFLTKLAVQLAPLGRAELTTLALNGQTIAAALCFIHNQRRLLYMVDHDPNHRSDSTNKILISRLIEQTFCEGGVFCLGAGNYAYKRDWTPHVGEVKSAIVFLNPQVREVLEPHLSKADISRITGF